MYTVKKTGTHIQLSVFYKALAHPARLAIVEILLGTKTCTCSGFVNELPLAQATISEHLRKLKQAGLVCVNEKGSSSQYSLDKQVFKQFMQLQQQVTMKIPE
jgi:ArsR family transcriptional regulator